MKRPVFNHVSQRRLASRAAIGIAILSSDIDGSTGSLTGLTDLGLFDQAFAFPGTLQLRFAVGARRAVLLGR